MLVYHKELLKKLEWESLIYDFFYSFSNDIELFLIECENKRKSKANRNPYDFDITF